MPQEREYIKWQGGGVDRGSGQKNLKEYENRDRGEDEKGQKKGRELRDLLAIC